VHFIILGYMRIFHSISAQEGIWDCEGT
jgi:hypothetical protein